MATTPSPGNKPADANAPAPEIVEPEESLIRDLTKMSTWHKIVVLAAIAAFAAIIISVWMWTQAADYRVLYSNLSDRDGGAIIETLQQQNIPYKFSEGGGTVLVPADKVHEIRLRLAAQGLPRGGPAGFELMENQKFGTSQFLEQVNYQRSLEGELSRSVQTLGSVQSARVHLAIPKPTVFVKDQQKPTASVVLTLHPGRSLDLGQVNAIVHLISSSIPNMPSANVTVVDQLGTLLSSIRETAESLDATQLKYVRQIEQDHIKRIEDILAPLMGVQNVRVQVTAEVDFTQAEQTAESYRPNQQANQSSIRSIQTTESKNGVSNNPAGVPGALSNQPPVSATAPIVTPASTVASATTENTSLHKEATTNYEVDRTIRHTKLPTGSLKRLSVAVLINNRSTTDSKGKTISKPFTPAEQAQLNNLIKNAMGFNAQRGDSLNLLNSAFTETPEIQAPEIPLWKQPEIIALAKEFLKYIFFSIAGLYILFGILRPILRKYIEIFRNSEVVKTQQATDDIKDMAKEFAAKRKDTSYDASVQQAKTMAQQTPKIVASVVQDWVNE
jgi:flagellar M-ring protein FliF